MNKLIKFLFLALFFIWQYSFAQFNNEIDSLKKVLRIAKSDTTKVQILNALSNKLWHTSEFIESKKYADTALTLADKLNFKRGKAISFHLIGMSLQRLDSLPEAIKMQTISMKLMEELADKNGIADCYYSIGNVNGDMGNNDEALKNYMVAKNIYLDSGNKESLSNTYSQMGLIYWYKGNFAEAVKNHLTSLKISEEIGYKVGMAKAYNNIAIIYDEQKKLPEALIYYLKALNMAEQLDHKVGMATCYLNIGVNYMLQHKEKEALEYLNKSLKANRDIGDKEGVSATYNNLGDVYSNMDNYIEALKNYRAATAVSETGEEVPNAYSYNGIGHAYIHLQKYADAKKYLDKSLELLKVGENQSILKENYKYRTELDTLTGNYQSALQNYMLYVTYKDSLLNEADNKNIAQIKEQYESEKKDKEIDLLNKENVIHALETRKQRQTRNYLIAGLILVVVLSFFVHKNYRTQNQLKLQTLRNKIASDLHDDVGSTLSSISMFTQMAQSQSKEVIPALETIGESSRKMLDAMADIVWTINPENDQFEKIIMRMRTFAYDLLGAKQMEFEFDADEKVSNINLPMNSKKNLYLIFKEATNNLVKYSEATKAKFEIKGDIHKFTMMIRDNGKGFDAAQEFSGNGLKNMKKRAVEIGAQLLIDSMPDNGTTIKLELAI